MHEVNDLDQLGIMVGTGRCDAACTGCAGVVHRPAAPREDGGDDFVRIERTIRECWARGARKITLSSSGEPTWSPKSVENTLKVIRRLRDDGLLNMSVFMYTNGIRIGTDAKFAEKWLPIWNALGLEGIKLSLHGTSREDNAWGFGVKGYPTLYTIATRLRRHGYRRQACLVLNQHRIGSITKLAIAAHCLEQEGFEMLTAWPLRDEQDRLHPEAPGLLELRYMKEWAEHRHGPMAVRVHIDDDREERYTRKLTLFPDGRLASAWTR